MYLEELTNLSGVSGNETEVRDFIIFKITPYADEITVDTMGNVIALKKGDSSKKVMLSAHMDEVGFIISEITEKGYLKFKTVGGIDTRTILAKRLRIGKNNILGVIGMKAVHLQKKSEREETPEIKDLFIDIGAKDKEDAEKLINLGDYATFETKFEQLSNETVKAKALDDRAGCAVLMETIKNPVKYDTYFCFTTQEEVGLRGARVVANRINPDIALVVESTSCSDVYGFEPHESVTKLGCGAAVTFMDGTTIVDNAFRKQLFEMAKEGNIPVQYKCSTSGGNDAGRIHLSGKGVKTASVSLPTRYIHSSASVASVKDLNAVLSLVKLFLERIDEVL
ncbi:MAG: M42 family metallopeptidase [Clostridia bacterium]|nr:M42 family metallopeptidase [Clostridia bacterium]